MKTLFVRSLAAVSALAALALSPVPAVAAPLPSFIALNVQGADINQASGATLQAAGASTDVNWAIAGAVKTTALAVNNVATVSQEIVGNSAVLQGNLQVADVDQVSYLTGGLAEASTEVGAAYVGDVTTSAIAGNNIGSITQSINDGCGC